MILSRRNSNQETYILFFLSLSYMTTFNSGYIADENRGTSSKLVGLKVPGITMSGDVKITSVTWTFGSSDGDRLDCYVQSSDGTVDKIGDTYVNNAAENHTFTSGTVQPIGDNFILFIYNQDATNGNVSVQYDGSTVGTGTELNYNPKTLTPLYANWMTSTCTNVCGIPLIMEYGASPSGGTRLPPPPAMVRL